MKKGRNRPPPPERSEADPCQGQPRQNQHPITSIWHRPPHDNDLKSGVESAPPRREPDRQPDNLARYLIRLLFQPITIKIPIGIVLVVAVWFAFRR